MIRCQTPLNRGDADYEPLHLYGFGLTYDDVDTLSDELPESGGRAPRSTGRGHPL